MSQESPASSGGKAAPFILGLVVGIVVTALVGGLIMLTTRSSGGGDAQPSPSASTTSAAPAPSTSSPAAGVTPEAIQSGLESLGLTNCTTGPAPNEGKTFIAVNVICNDPKVDTNKVSVAVVTKNFEGARADLCRDVSADKSIQNVVIVSDKTSFIAIGGKNVLEFPDPPTAEDVAKATSGSAMTVLDFCKP